MIGPTLMKIGPACEHTSRLNAAWVADRWLGGYTRSVVAAKVGWHPGAVVTVASLHRSTVCAVAPAASTTVRGVLV